jgi:sugar phosphate isomerase/epimerase
MNRYAVSVKKFGETIERAREYVEAFSQSKIKQIELSFFPFVEESMESKIHLLATREFLANKDNKIASVHLPYMGGGKSWDISTLDETLRKDVTKRLGVMIKKHADLIPKEVTLHCSMEPPLEEHPARVDQVCRSLEELLPLAYELDFSFNVEYLPRKCIGNCPEELLKIASNFNNKHVGICMDVNHVMHRYNQLPQIIDQLSKYIHSFHLSDFDGIDEKHWFPGQGIINWTNVMQVIKKITNPPLLILETEYQLGLGLRQTSMFWHLKQVEDTCFYLENIEELEQRKANFQL